MAEPSLFLLFFMMIVSFVSMIVLFAAGKALNGWKRTAARILAVLSGISFALQLFVLMVVLALGGFT